MKAETCCSLLIFLIVFFFQCKTDHTKTVSKSAECNGFVLKATEQKDSLTLQELTDSLIVIKLETNSQSLFGDITKLEILNDTIIVLDFRNQIVFTFDFKGNFIGKIGTIGKGPNEMLAIKSFTIDKGKNEVLIFDDKNSKIYHYNLNGKLISWEDARIYACDFIAQNNHLIYYQDKSPVFFNERTNFDLLITKDRKIVKRYLPFLKPLSFRYPLNRMFYELNDTACFIDKWNSKVYSIANDSLLERYCIDFMGNEIPFEYTEDEKSFDANHKEYAYLFDYVIENRSHIFFRYYWKGKLKKTIFDKRANGYYTFSNRKDEADILPSAFAPIYSYNDFFVSSLPPYLLIDAVEAGKVHHNDLMAKAQNLQSSDNLLLVLIKLN